MLVLIGVNSPRTFSGASGFGFNTVTGAVASLPRYRTSRVASPVRSAFTTPCSFTLATLGAFDSTVASRETSLLPAPGRQPAAR